MNLVVSWTRAVMDIMLAIHCWVVCSHWVRYKVSWLLSILRLIFKRNSYDDEKSFADMLVNVGIDGYG